MGSQRPVFQSIQYAFAAHIREPDKYPRPKDVEERRMAIYRDLFFHNVEGFLSSGFPVLRTLYSDTDWQGLVRGFFAEHRCHTPYFLEISEEFMRYLQEERTPQPEDPPFLLELAHYEWVELALSISEEKPNWEAINPHGDLLRERPSLSPLAWLLSYQFPVHKISHEFIPRVPSEQPTHLMVYRDRRDEVGFMELNPVTARLVALMRVEPARRGIDLLKKIAQELQHPNPERVIQGGMQTLLKLRNKDVILGTYK
jgi:hypothetical protein